MANLFFNPLLESSPWSAHSVGLCTPAACFLAFASSNHQRPKISKNSTTLRRELIFGGSETLQIGQNLGPKEIHELTSPCQTKPKTLQQDSKLSNKAVKTPQAGTKTLRAPSDLSRKAYKTLQGGPKTCRRAPCKPQNSGNKITTLQEDLKTQEQKRFESPTSEKTKK